MSIKHVQSSWKNEKYCKQRVKDPDVVDEVVHELVYKDIMSVRNHRLSKLISYYIGCTHQLHSVFHRRGPLTYIAIHACTNFCFKK